MTIMLGGHFLRRDVIGAYLSTVFLTSLVPRGEFGQLDARGWPSAGHALPLPASAR